MLTVREGFSIGLAKRKDRGIKFTNPKIWGGPPTHRGGAKDPYQFLISREYSRKGILKGVSGGVTLSGTKATILEH